MKKIKKLKIFVSIVVLIMLIAPIKVGATDNTNYPNSVYVIPGGEPFGIKMFSEGVIVIKTEEFVVNGKKLCPGKSAGLKENDLIYSANEKLLSSNNELKDIIENYSGESIKLKIKRNGKFSNIDLIPQKDESGIYKAGIWVKDSAAGLGTITFYSEQTNTFCGLGHGICDKDTGGLIPLSYGELDKANISSVTKSSCGNVGTLNGYFTDEIIGTAASNHKTGIYGYLQEDINVSKTQIEIADRNEVQKGKAYILTTLSGETPKKYEVEITKLNMKSDTTNITLRITDEELLNISGGIVQGMSGSPIIQNGKLIGALTHVLVDNVNYGYGIFASTMYEVMLETC